MTTNLTDYLQDSLVGEPAPQKISAYYSLVFPTFTYYLQTLNVTIGRRCIPCSSASSSDNPQVDVDLGPLKSVSRLHAKIEYEEEEERFVLVVIGRNGAWVDGVWSGSGSKVPLGERSQIQIASRTFHFVLPPPPAPEDSPSPSSQSSVENRPRSPSVDIVDVTSISPPSSLPSCSPPPAVVLPAPPKIPPRAGIQLPNSNTIRHKSNTKKRKKSDPQNSLPLPPEVIPPKPQLTYAQLCYRAIKALGGKGSLQDICHWIKETYEWYKYCGKDWESSVRHNLSSNPGFKKLLRSKDEKGKGALWVIDEAFEHTFEELDAKRQAAAALAASGGVDGKAIGKRGRVVIPLEPPFKRSVKGDLKGMPLPPPLTSTPLTLKTNSHSPANTAPPSTSDTPPITLASSDSTVKLETPALHIPASRGLSSSSTASIVTPSPGLNNATAVTPEESASTRPSATPFPAIPASVRIPIIIGPVPPSSPPQSSDPASSTPKPIVLHDNTLILNPEIFSHLTPEHLKDLEGLGAQKALEILQSYIVRYYKEKLKAEGGRGRGRGRPRRGRGAAGGRGSTSAGAHPRTDAPTAGPFAPAPLLPPAVEPLPMTAMAHETPAHPNSDVAFIRTTPTSDVLWQAVDAAPSPIVVIDDDPAEEEGPAMKRRRLENGMSVSTSAT
ncbi:hypothetical protein BKA93DRAFT_743520 [Sparassis latifolia]